MARKSISIRLRPNQITLLPIAVLASLIILTTLIGMSRFHSPVPFWDMWNGTVGFFARASEGDGRVWFEQHNEHRIFLSKILFYVDFAAFGGRGAFLVLMNFVIAGASAAALVMFARDALAERSPPLAAGVALVCVAAALSWMQQENLVWAFQSQFFLVQALPLWAFYLLHRAEKAARLRAPYLGFFTGAAALGALSSLAMANGVIVLPLMAVMTLFAGAARWRTVALLGLAALVAALYFSDYHSPGNHGTLPGALRENPIGVIQYTLVYLGSPLFHMLGGRGLWIATLGGVVMAAATAFLLARDVVMRQVSTVRLALIFMLAFLGASAFVTAGGRLMFGLITAMSGRYATPALIAWAAFLILVASAAAPALRKRTGLTLAALALVPLALLAHQRHAFAPTDHVLENRRLAALALEVGADDIAALDAVMPDGSNFRDIGRLAASRNYSVFGADWLRDAGLELGDVARLRDESTTGCQAFLDGAAPIVDETEFVRVEGWFLSPNLNGTKTLLRFVDADGRIVGFADYGRARPDVAEATGAANRRSGFTGYVRGNAAPGRLAVSARKGGCEAEIEVGAFPYRAVTTAAGMKLAQDLVANAGFVAPIDGPPADSAVLSCASNPGGDASTGTISIRMTRGEALYYQSGPVAKRQRLTIDDRDDFVTTLPTVRNWTAPRAESWSLVVFDHTDLPESFTVHIADEGDAWGEWSAISIGARAGGCEAIAARPDG